MIPNIWSVIRSIPMLGVLVKVAECQSEVNMHRKMSQNVGMPGQSTRRLINGITVQCSSKLWVVVQIPGKLEQTHLVLGPSLVQYRRFIDRMLENQMPATERNNKG
jgi:hypothetical protein